MKNEFKESRDNIIHFDVERQIKSQSKKHGKKSVEMIKWISFAKSQAQWYTETRSFKYIYK